MGFLKMDSPEGATGLNKSFKHKADVVQMQTPISTGNSGGPLFSSDGIVIGVNTLGDPEGQNLNFKI